MGLAFAHQIAAGGIRRPGAHPPFTEVGEQIEKCGDPRLVGVMDDKFEDPRLEKLDGDRAARAAGADQECPRAFRLGSMVFLRLHEGEPVEHVAMPRAVGIAADHTHDSEHLGSFGTGGAVGEGRELVRHRDQDAVHVPRGREAGHDGVKVCVGNLHRHADAVRAALGERASKTLRGLYVLDRVTDDREQPGSATEVIKHVHSSCFRIAEVRPRTGTVRAQWN
jgi:hypothetical protein